MGLRRNMFNKASRMNGLAAQGPQGSGMVASKPGLGGAPLKLALLVIGAVIVIAGIGYFAWNQLKGDGVKHDQYQAVFLNNGQVYFGKLANPDSSRAELTDIYYLQVQQSVQPADSGDQQNGQDNGITLIKLGEELHGPEDKMVIYHDQILFWENLKKDGKVTKAIEENQKK